MKLMAASFVLLFFPTGLHFYFLFVNLSSFILCVIDLAGYLLVFKRT